MSTFNAVKVALVLQLATVLGSKLIGVKVGRGEKQVDVGNIGFKLKAHTFINNETAVGQIGALRILGSRGNCINCDITAQCSTPDDPWIEGDDVQKACNPYPENGSNWSWHTNSAHNYDILIEFPEASLNDERNFTIEVFSACSASGVNQASDLERQATSWIVNAVHRTSSSTASWIKRALPIRGDFEATAHGSTNVEIPNEGSDLYAELCASPNIPELGYGNITEYNLERGKFHVEVSCMEGHVGNATAVECSGDGLEYTFNGCTATS